MIGKTKKQRQSGTDPTILVTPIYAILTNEICTSVIAGTGLLKVDLSWKPLSLLKALHFLYCLYHFMHQQDRVTKYLVTRTNVMLTVCVSLLSIPMGLSSIEMTLLL